MFQRLKEEKIKCKRIFNQLKKEYVMRNVKNSNYKEKIEKIKEFFSINRK